MFKSNSMLEQLFSSKVRVKLLAIFLAGKPQSYYVRELTRRLDERINSVRLELANLEGLGLLKSRFQEGKKYYYPNDQFKLYPELKRLIFKAGLEGSKLARDIEQLAGIKFACLSGKFIGLDDSPVDLFVVGRINKKALVRIVRKLEEGLGEELNYTVVSLAEFLYRQEMHDRFVDTIFKSDYLKLVDRIGSHKPAELDWGRI